MTQPARDAWLEIYKQTFSYRSTHRLFIVKATAPPSSGGLECFSSTAMAATATQHLGDWWTSTATVTACEALDRALAGAPVPASGVVEELLHFAASLRVANVHVHDGPRVRTTLRRRTAFVTGAGAALQADEWTEGDSSQAPSALLLTHRFAALLPNAASLVLRTLFLADRLYETTPAGMVHDVFQDRVPALRPESHDGEHKGVTTDVLINERRCAVER
jgi:hypothetical protein